MDRPLSLFAKLVLIGAGGLAIVVGPVLYLFPNDTATYFAWTINHPLTPIFMGASYFAGIGVFITIRVNRWSLARIQFPAILVFASTMLLATLLHIQIFNWSHPVAWAWLAVYIVSPVAAGIVFTQMERGFQTPRFESKGIPKGFSSLMIMLAALYGLIGLALFLFPEATASFWPWSLTPLTARVIGGWWLSGVALQVMLSRQKTLHTAHMGLLATVLTSSLLILGALMHFNDLNGPKFSIFLYFLLNLISGGASAYYWIKASKS